MSEARRRGKIDIRALIAKSAARSGYFDAARSRAIARRATRPELFGEGYREIRRMIDIETENLQRASTVEESELSARTLAELRECHSEYLTKAVTPATLSGKTKIVGQLIRSSRKSEADERRLGLPKIR